MSYKELFTACSLVIMASVTSAPQAMTPQHTTHDQTGATGD